MSDDKKILCILPICCYPTNNNSNTGYERIQQYVTGLNKFFEYNDILKKHNVDIYVSDNSIKDGDSIPIEILNIIPENVKTISFLQNNFGRINKGAGLIEQWLYCKDIIKKYDWLIHFEPRQLLFNFNFFNNFLENTRNLFTIGCNNIHFNTGLFCIDTNTIIKYSLSTDLIKMVNKSISIEYDLYNYIKQYNIYYDVLDKMNLIWFDTISQKQYLM